MESTKKSTYIHLAVMLACFVGIGMLPPFGQITPVGMKILGVFVGTLYGWMFIPGFAIPSILGMVFLGLTGYTTVTGAFMAGFGVYTVVMMLMTFPFVALLNEINLTGALANWFLARKFVNGHPWRIIALLFSAAWILAAFADGLAAILLFWSIIYKIADEVGWKRHSKEVGYMITGNIFFSGMGAYLFPFKASAIMFLGGYTAVMGPVPQMNYYFILIFTAILFLLFYLLVGKLVGINVSVLTVDLSQYATSTTWNKKEKWGMFFTVFFILFLCIPVWLPATIPFVAAWKNLGIIGASVIILTMAHFIQVDGKSLCPRPFEMFSKGINWDLILMIAATMPIGAALRSDAGGIITTLLAWLMAIIGNMHWIVFTVICAIALGLLTQVSHNLIISAVLFPVFAPVCADLGGDPVLWVMIMFLTINAAFTTPAASGWAAMLHGNTEWMSVKTAYGFGFSTLVVVWLAMFTMMPVYLLIF